MLKFNCPACGTAINAPENAQGKHGKCPQCGSAVSVPQSRGSRQEAHATKPAPERELVEAHEFALINNAGATVARLTSAEDGQPALILFDTEGTTRAKLEVGDKSLLSLFDADGLIRLQIGVTETFEPLIKLRGEDGATGVEIGMQGCESVVQVLNTEENSGVQIAAAEAPVIGIMGPEKKLRMTLGLSGELSAIGILADDAVPCLRLGVSAEGQASIQMTRADNKLGIGLGLFEDGSASIVLADNNGVGRASLSVYPDAGAVLGLADAAGKARASLGEAMLGFMGAEKKSRVVLSLSQEGNALLLFVDAAGKPRASIETTADGAATLGLFDGEGNLIFSAPKIDNWK